MKYGLKRRLALLLCIAMTVNPMTAFAAELDVEPVQDILAEQAAEEQTAETMPEQAPEAEAQQAPEEHQAPQAQQAQEMPAAEASAEAGYDITAVAGSGVTDVYSALEKEEIREELGAESVENIDFTEVIDEAALQAEIAEKEAYDKGLDEGNVDDSGKVFDDNMGIDKDPSDGTYGGDVPEGGWFSSDVSDKFSFTIGYNGTSYNDTLDVAIKKAVESGKPVYFTNNGGSVNIYSTAKIPEEKKVELHLNGASLVGRRSDELGNNEIFKVLWRSTLRIYGSDDKNRNAKIMGGGDGAIIANNEATVELNNLTLTDNQAKYNGGALYLNSQVNCRLNNVSFYSNRAGRHGGALFVNGSNTNVHMDADTVFSNNHADNNGGAIYINDEKASLYGPAGGKVTVNNNRAEGYGGGLYVDKSGMSAYSFRFTGNNAGKEGGGVYINGSDCGLSNSELTGNKAQDSAGGGIYVNDTGFSLSNVTITNNWARLHGNGVYVDSRYNLGTGGKIIIKDNFYNGTPTDLCLETGMITQAYLKAASYDKGSRIGIEIKEKEGRRITYAPGNYDTSVFYMNKNYYKDPDNWFIGYGQDADKKSLYRHLYVTQTRSAAHAADYTELDNRANTKNKTQKESDKNYVAADGGSYDVYSGYASGPNFSDDDRDVVTKYFWSDGYFFDDPKTYNPHLATFGMNLAYSSANSNVAGHDDYSYKYENVKNVLKGIGCENIYISPSYIIKPTENTIGYAIGRKEIKSKADNTAYTLIPIVVRSINYEKEWAGNMTINGDNTHEDNGSHSGFKKAGTMVAEAVKDYVAKNGLESSLKAGRVKFFVAGYSRGSATANFAAAELVNTYGELNSGAYKKNDVFAYCYEVPAGATDSDDESLSKGASAYFCIHNIINKVDLVPLTAPDAMGFKRYGVDHYVPGSDAGDVKKNIKYATAENGGYKLTTYYDNSAYLTNSSAYASKRPDMLKQLALVNQDINFIDYFKETDLDISLGQAVRQKIKGALTYLEAEPVQFNEVKNSTLTLEEWLPVFFKTFQSYNTVGKDKKLTRHNYSNEVIRAGKKNPSKKEKNWYNKGTTAQDTFKSLVVMMMSKSPAEMAELGLSLAGLKNKLSTGDLFDIDVRLIQDAFGWDFSEGRQQDFLDMFWNKLNDDKYGQKSIRDGITDKAELAAFENSFPSLMSIVMRVLVQDRNSNDFHNRLLGTFANNSSTIVQGHAPEMVISWLRTYDDYYKGETKAYKWKEEGNFLDTDISLTGVNTGTYYNFGSCSGTLKCDDPSAEIYYTVECDGVTTQPALYQEGGSLFFAAPEGDGVKTYTVTAWIYRSRAAKDQKVEISRYLNRTDDKKEFTVKTKTDKVTVTLKSQIGTDEAKVCNTYTVDKGKTIHLRRYDFGVNSNDYTLVGYYVGDETSPRTHDDNESLDLIINDDTTITAKFKPKVEEVILGEDFYNELVPKAGVEFKKTVTADKVKYKLYGVDEPKTGSNSQNVNVEWKKRYIKWKGLLYTTKWEPVTETKPIAGAKYWAIIEFDDKKNTVFDGYEPKQGVTLKDETGRSKDTGKYRGIGRYYEFYVDPAVSALEPPAATPDPGTYTAGDPELEDGSLKVTLTNPNNGSSDIKYTLKKDGTVVSENQVYNAPISLSMNEADSKVTYKLSAYCATENETAKSDTAEWTYVLTPAAKMHTLKVFVDDYNDKAEPDEIRNWDDHKFNKIDSVAEDEEILIDLDDLFEEEGFMDGYRVVSWNAVDLSTGADEDIPDSDDSLLFYNMPGHDVCVRALMAPIVQSIDVGVDMPETGCALPGNPYSVKMTIGDVPYEIDPDTVSVTWVLSENSVPASGIAEANTAYNAIVTVSAGNLSALVDDLDNPVSEKLNMKYFIFDDAILKVSSDREGEDVPKDVADCFVIEDEKGFADTIEIERHFSETGGASFIGIDVPEGKTVSWNGNWNNRYENQVKPNRPNIVNVYVDDDSYQTLSVNWVENMEETVKDDDGSVLWITTDGVAYDEAGYLVDKDDIDGPDDESLLLSGNCVIPNELQYDRDEETGKPMDPAIEEIKNERGEIIEARYNFLYPITLEGAPVSNMPDITPVSDEFYVDDDIIVDFDTFPVTASGNKVDIYYMITEAPDYESASEDEDFFADMPCWYGENWQIVKDPDAKKLSANGANIEDRRIIGSEWMDKGADGVRVSAIAVEDGCRMSEVAYEDYYFYDKRTAVVPEEVMDKLNSLKMPSGSSLNSLAGQLPEGCSFDPDQDLTAVRKGKAGEKIYAYVVYNPDPETYRDDYIEIGIELTAGIYDIIVENGTAYLVDPEKYEWTEVTRAEAMSTIVLSANAAPEGKEFDQWAVYTETGDEIDYKTNAEDPKQISFDMPNAEVYAIAVYKDKSGASSDTVQSLTLDRSTISLTKNEEAKITANVTYAAGAADKPEVEFKCAQSNISLAKGAGNTVTVKALSTGSAVVWAVCGQMAVSCTVTVGEERLYVEATGSCFTLPDGSIIRSGTVARGARVTLTADAPRNEALKFKEWQIAGANIDKTKNPVSFTVTDDILADAVYTEADGYADAGDYPKTSIKIKSLKLTDTVKGKKISKASIGVNKSMKVKAIAEYVKNDTVKPEIEFRSSNTDVVKVKYEKTVEGVSVANIVGCDTGTAVVTAYCGNKTSKLSITVEGEDITGIALFSDRLVEKNTAGTQYRLVLKSGEQELVKMNPKPFDSTSELKVTWKSDDNKVASVTNGLITAKFAEKGRTTIRVMVKSRPRGAKKWIQHEPVLIDVDVSKIAVPKKIRQDKSFSFGLKGSQTLDLDAALINRKNVVSECNVELKVKGSVKNIVWKSTNEDVVRIVNVSDAKDRAVIKAAGIGTAYITVMGSNSDDPSAAINMSVMKVTVKATAPKVCIIDDAKGLISEDGKTLTIKEGSYDTLYYSVMTDPDTRYPNNVSQVPRWSASGGVTVKDGVIYAKKATKAGKPAKVTLSCGRGKFILNVIVQ